MLHRNIRTFRLRKGLSQAELARRLGLAGRSSVSQWETGAAPPRTELLPKLAEELDVTVGDLFEAA